MRVAFFSTKPYDRRFFDAANASAAERGQPAHELVYFESRLRPETVPLAAQYPALCLFVNDDAHRPVLAALADAPGSRTRLLALRCAGFNNVDLDAAHETALTVARVPGYSPYAVAEHTVALILALNRRIPRAHNRVRDGNLSLDGLLGFDLNGTTVGILGTGRIGLITARILAGFGCLILAYDPYPNPEIAELGGRYADLPDILPQADILSLHCPLSPATYHLIDDDAVRRMKPGVMIINTSRGALIDTHAVIHGLKTGRIGYLGLDVYEEEADLFYQDLSGRVIQDDVFARLLTLPNVLITGHQAFFTRNALTNIAETTLANITAFERGELSGNEVTEERLIKAASR